MQRRVLFRAVAHASAAFSRAHAVRHISFQPPQASKNAIKKFSYIFGGSIVIGSIIGLTNDVVSDMKYFGASARSSSLHLIPTSAEIRQITADINGQSLTIIVKDDKPCDYDENKPVVLLAADSVSLLSDVEDSICKHGKLRCLSYEVSLNQENVQLDLDTQTKVLSTVLNSCDVSQPLVVVSTGVEWLPALGFIEKNLPNVAGLVLVDPILPQITAQEVQPATHPTLSIRKPAADWIDSDASGSPSARLSPSMPTNAASQSRASHEVAGILHQLKGSNSEVVEVKSWDPLHFIEHLLTGDTHHHLLSGGDHRHDNVHYSTASSHAVDAAPFAAEGRQVKWRSVEPSTAVSRSEHVSDTLDASAIHLERIYQDRLADVTRKPHIRDMIPSFGQSLMPSFLRGFTLRVPGLPISVQFNTDARIAALDNKLTTHLPANMTQMEAVVARLQAVSQRIPTSVRITTPSFTQTAERDDGMREHYLLENRMDKRGMFVAPTEAEVKVRALLEVDARNRLTAWKSLLPGKCVAIAAAPAVSGQEVFDPEPAAVLRGVESVIKATP